MADLKHACILDTQCHDAEAAGSLQGTQYKMCEGSKECVVHGMYPNTLDTSVTDPVYGQVSVAMKQPSCTATQIISKTRCMAIQPTWLCHHGQSTTVNVYSILCMRPLVIEI